MKTNAIAKRILISVMTAFILLNGMSCDSANDLTNFPLENFVIVDFIKYTIRIEKSVFEFGESVNVDFIVKNISFKKIDIGLSTISSDFEISVKKGSELVFFWPQAYATACSGFTLQRGESKEYSFTWDSRNNIPYSMNYDQYVSPGIYTVVMRLKSYTHEFPGISIRLEIK